MKNSSKGFTLIELLIVIAIIGILAAVLIPNLLSARTRAQSVAGQAYAREVLTALESLQGTNTSLSYAETAAAVALTGATGIPVAVTLGAAGSTVPFTQPQVAAVLKAGTNGINIVTYYPATLGATVANMIEVAQTINGAQWCQELQLDTNKITSTQAACNGTRE